MHSPRNFQRSENPQCYIIAEINCPEKSASQKKVICFQIEPLVIGAAVFVIKSPLLFLSYPIAFYKITNNFSSPNLPSSCSICSILHLLKSECSTSLAYRRAASATSENSSVPFFKNTPLPAPGSKYNLPLQILVSHMPVHRRLPRKSK